MKEIAAAAILAIAIITDVSRGKVSNRLMLTGWLTGLILQFATDGVAGIRTWFLGVSIPVVLCSILFFMRVLGAGDVKLFSVLGGLSDLEEVSICMLCSFLVGAGIALMQMLRKKIFWSRMNVFRTYVLRVVAAGKLLPYEGQAIPDEEMDVLEKNLSENTSQRVTIEDYKMHFTIAIGIGYVICRGYITWVS